MLFRRILWAAAAYGKQPSGLIGRAPIKVVRVFSRGKLLIEFETEGHPSAIHVTSSERRGCAAYILNYLCQMDLCACGEAKQRQARRMVPQAHNGNGDGRDGFHEVPPPQVDVCGSLPDPHADPSQSRKRSPPDPLRRSRRPVVFTGRRKGESCVRDLFARRGPYSTGPMPRRRKICRSRGK